jgi:hypothetical protein
VNHNHLLAVNFFKEPGGLHWDDVIGDVLQHATMWAVTYLVEKVIVTYVMCHYHSRSDRIKLEHSKDIHNALIILYDASVRLHSVHGHTFRDEDLLIRNAIGHANAKARIKVSSYLARMGIDGYRIAGFFGNYISDDPKSHWMQPSSSYATVERSLCTPRPAAALARRIWRSFAMKGSDKLTADDIADVLGPHKREEAQRCFRVLDENENGDISLEEMVLTLINAGKIRRNIYQNMADMDRCINTFDWICLAAIAAIMIFFIGEHSLAYPLSLGLD